ncbi:porin family protein [Winogradskyella endarachnes]|uniref:Outer membrane beta-barrel protein n=1 Tax=Winogradskyella endarachnes TaxID=2681965 RepID=A0A6L6UEP4_9FLAO|nr:porin family protein [Winogradskyella endarachnes]MUU79297.1 outer membrane beta-barrel protein [Winogradskyella endarachnes]
MKNVVFLILILISYIGNSQSDKLDNFDTDYQYREDQFYASVTYNIINHKPSGVSQSGFSSGFNIGFIRDMPINKNRNIAFGIGLGLSSNSYNQKNLLIEEVANGVTFTIIDEDDYDVSKNKFTTYLIEVPFEFRWRTSNAEDYNFWRIYTGFKVGYLLYNSVKFESETLNSNLYNSGSFEKLQYGLTLSAGYSTWNFYLYYGLNPIFDSSLKLEESGIEMKPINIGLMFYIL